MGEMAACPDCGAAVATDRREQHRRWHTDQEAALAELVNRLARLERTAREAGNVWRSVAA